jgi:hypothetical protein
MTTTTTTPHDAASSPAPTAPGDAILLTPPPPGTAVPRPPAGFVLPGAGVPTAALPRKAELAALPGVVHELFQSTDYDKIFGITGISQAHVVQVFDLARQWSGMYQASDEWGRYARTQEAMAWAEARALMNKMKMAFELASLANPGDTAGYMNLRSFLGFAKAVAKKGASTRRANGKATANGQPAVHGAAGKKREKAAQKAAYEAAKKEPS